MVLSEKTSRFPGKVFTLVSDLLPLCCDRSLRRPPLPLGQPLPAPPWCCLPRGSKEEGPSTAAHPHTTCLTSPPSPTSRGTPSRFEPLALVLCPLLSDRSNGGGQKVILMLSSPRPLPRLLRCISTPCQLLARGNTPEPKVTRATHTQRGKKNTSLKNIKKEIGSEWGRPYTARIPW